MPDPKRRLFAATIVTIYEGDEFIGAFSTLSLAQNALDLICKRRQDGYVCEKDWKVSDDGTSALRAGISSDYKVKAFNVDARLTNT